jgi:hypothetical protein
MRRNNYYKRGRGYYNKGGNRGAVIIPGEVVDMVVEIIMEMINIIIMKKIMITKMINM